ncbi:MAG: hypothetical protein MRJ68_19120 [Nitrospira sp.]|nr:hypothetical protein [Nitrospira sp.]
MNDQQRHEFYKSRTPDQLKEIWSNFHKMRKQALADGDFKRRGLAEKRLTELKPYLQRIGHKETTVRPSSGHIPTSVQPVDQPESRLGDSTAVQLEDCSKRFNFYMVAAPSTRLDQLCHAIFAQWLTFRGFKRQTSAEKLADYRQMITCILCNLVYHGTVRVSRDKADFARAVSHYRPSVFNKRFLTVLDNLHEMGVIVQTKGQRYKRDFAKVFGITKAKYMTQDSILTRLSAGTSLAEQLHGIRREDVMIETETQEVVMLKRDAGSELVEYEETPHTIKYRREMKLVNEFLSHAGSLLTVEGATRFDNRARFLVRKFTYNSFEKGGRLWGGLWDSPMKKSERSELLRIQGERTAEVDFDSIIVHLAYALHGEEPPRPRLHEAQQSDMYSIPGLHPESRPGIKKFIGAHLFRESDRKRFPKDKDTGESIQKHFHISDQSKSYTQVLDLIKAVHPALVNDFFGTGVGHHLQFLESQLMVNTLLRCQQKRIVCFPLHDALIVREDQAERVAAIMEGTSLMVLGRRIPVSVKGQNQGLEAA